MKFIKDNKAVFWVILFCFILTIGINAAITATFQKGSIGVGDLAWWDGTGTRTTDRTTSEGYTLTMRRFETVGVNLSAAYGGSVNHNSTTIQSALTATGSSQKAIFWLAPVTWSITDDITITSNITLAIPPGATLDVTAGKTITIQGPLFTDGLYQVAVDGTLGGEIAFTSNKVIAWMYPEFFGAAGDNSTDDETEINLALFTGLNVRLTSRTGYRVDDELHFGATAGQLIVGNSDQITLISVDSSYDNTEDGVIQWGASGQGVKNIRILFTRDDETAYSAALDLNAKTFAKVQNVRIEKAYDGIDATGDVYGLLIDGLEISSFNFGIETNGANGDVRLRNLYFSPNVGTLDASQITQMDADNCYGIKMTGATKGFSISGHFDIGTGIWMAAGASYGSVSDTTFVNENGILVAAGNISIGTSTFLVNGTDEQAIEATGGTVSIGGGTQFFITAALSDPAIDISGGADLILTGSYLSGAANNFIMVYGTGAGTILNLSGNTFNQTDAAHAAAVINAVSSAELYAVGNNINTTTNDNDFIATDTAATGHVITNNRAPGWDIDVAALTNNAVLFGNIVEVGGPDIDQNRLLGKFNIKYFEGTLAGDGTATITHGLTTPANDAIILRGLYRSAANTAGVMDSGELTIDGTNINVAGTAGALDTAKYRIIVIYSSQNTDWS